MSAAEPGARPHHAVLRQRFVARLLAERPASVLDVGCGDASVDGSPLSACRDAGVPAVGLEVDAVPAAAGCAAGLRVLRARAEGLPFADGAFDWVTLRHVPHHLADPPAGLREAWRVARTGVLVAEPWFDPRLPGQALALDVERWLKAHDRRRGRVHGECLAPAEILRAFPSAGVAIEVEHVLLLSARPAGWLAEAGERALADLPPTAPERAALAALLERERREGLTGNGSAIVRLRRS